MTLVNAWLLYRRDCQSQMPEIAHLPLLDFKIQVASCLCMKSKVSNKRKGRPSQAVVVGKNKRGPQSFVPPDPVRRDCTDHWSLHASEKGRCKMPGCKGIVRSKCSKCAVFLCFTAERNCFVDFHKAWIEWNEMKRMNSVFQWDRFQVPGYYYQTFQITVEII